MVVMPFVQASMTKSVEDIDGANGIPESSD